MSNETTAAAPDEQDQSLEALEREGDLAADFLEPLLDIADFDGDLDLAVANGRATISVTGGGEELIQFATPDVVQALQDLTRLAVQQQTGEFSRLILDIGGSRAAREAELHREVDAAIAQLAAGKAEVKLPAMSSYERKVVHDYVAERGYHSESHGEGRDRRLVITSA
ncbi:R3H domain-containing nucleic acid-binding protein [Leucobacter sp. OH1287]|uniref:Jag family protein n=1 Tax=Leucobacter sp. OH1287 TaxID=2491049 RepID=UPI000F601946|nr:R3H domain-containing nucleic acid-binding protein [Leucobacter sp. OH1287]RRD60361.1 DNA-binding protein [Leucobacter sp. OH1287]